MSRRASLSSTATKTKDISASSDVLSGWIGYGCGRMPVCIRE